MQKPRIVIAVLIALFTVTAGVRAQCIEGSTVLNSNLLNGLQGFGQSTTGGLGGTIYIVTSTADSGEEGTLRYAVESLSCPVWIVFHPNVFPPATQTVIDLVDPLRFTYRNDVTIDGRGSYVTLRRVMSGPCTGTSDREIINIRSSKNIILSHLDFSRLYSNSDSLDKEAYGDIVEIYNSESQTSIPGVRFDRIWINNSNFYDCGDECIGMSHFNDTERSYISISRSEFIGIQSPDEKGIFIGNELFEDNPFGVAVTLYWNRFYNLSKRLPRIAHGILRAYDNAFEMWNSYGIAAVENTRVMLENNVFRSSSSSLKDDAWEIVGTDNSIWARDNRFWTTSGSCPAPPGGTGLCETTSFPGCSDSGGPWYYDCSELVTDITQFFDFDWWLEYIRGIAGWANEPNDVRDLWLTNVGDRPAAVMGISWLGATPNPFNPSTQLRFRLQNPGDVTVRIVSASGRLVRRIALTGLSAGEQSLRWDGLDDSGSQAATGAYLVLVEAGEQRVTGRVALLK